MDNRNSAYGNSEGGGIIMMVMKKLATIFLSIHRTPGTVRSVCVHQHFTDEEAGA